MEDELSKELDDPFDSFISDKKLPHLIRNKKPDISSQQREHRRIITGQMRWDMMPLKRRRGAMGQWEDGYANEDISGRKNNRV